MMENLYPGLQDLEGFSRYVESKAEHYHSTTPLSLEQEADFLVKCYLWQQASEKGFLAAVERYKDALVESARYRADLVERENAKQKSREGRSKHGERIKEKRNQAVYEAIRELFKEGEEVFYRNYASRFESKKGTLRTKELFPPSTFHRALKDLRAQGRLDEDNKLAGPAQT